MVNRRFHLRAVLQALVVTFLWSSSWVLIKMGLKEIPALPFAGLRYAIAFLCLLPFTLRTTVRAQLRRLGTGDWLVLVILGVLYYAVTQGAQFLSLEYLPAASANLVLSFTSILVALLGIPILGEAPSASQWMGIGLAVLGALVYLNPENPPTNQALGFGVAVLGLLTNSLSSILGRRANRSKTVGPLIVTVISMGVGSAVLLPVGIWVQGFPDLTLESWIIVLWLALGLKMTS